MKSNIIKNGTYNLSSVHCTNEPTTTPITYTNGCTIGIPNTMCELLSELISRIPITDLIASCSGSKGYYKFIKESDDK